MTAFGAVFGAVLPVFLVTGAGFVLRRLAWLTEEADRSLLQLTINVLLGTSVAGLITIPLWIRAGLAFVRP